MNFRNSKDLSEAGASLNANDGDSIELHFVENKEDLPGWATLEMLTDFLHYKMQPYHDEWQDVLAGLEYAFSDEPAKGGFAVLAAWEHRLVGAVVFLKTDMKGYVPGNLLLFIAVDPEWRNRGIGERLIRDALGRCQGDVKLHVEPDNPAARLYKRIGFEHKYVEMRYKQSE